MRTTLEIDDDVMAAAQDLARLKKQGLGRTISELARSGLTAPTATVEMRTTDHPLQQPLFTSHGERPTIGFPVGRESTDFSFLG